MPRESTTHLAYITLLIAVLVAAWLLWPKPQVKVVSVVRDSVVTVEKLAEPITIVKREVITKVVRVPVAIEQRGDTSIYKYSLTGEVENDSVRVSVEHKFSINDKTMHVKSSTMKIDAQLKIIQVKTITNNITVMREQQFIDRFSLDAGLALQGGTLRPYVGASFEIGKVIVPVRVGIHLSN